MPGILSRFMNRNAMAITDQQVVNAILGDTVSVTGVSVSPETSLRSTAVFACVRVLSETLASLPLITYRRLSRGKERATDFYLYPILHDRRAFLHREIGYSRSRVGFLFDVFSSF